MQNIYQHHPMKLWKTDNISHNIYLFKVCNCQSISIIFVVIIFIALIIAIVTITIIIIISIEFTIEFDIPSFS